MDYSIYRNLFSEEEINNIVNEFFDGLVPTNRSHNFFVNWDKIEKHIKKYEIEFNILNTLIKCDNFDSKLKELLKKYPEIIESFPILFALSKSKARKAKRNNGKLQVINDFMDRDAGFTNYNFKKRDLSNKEISKFIDFFEKTGLKYFFKNLAEKSILDFAFGVDVGMDTHARKNRSGKAMELAVEPIIKNILSEIDKNDEIDLITQKKFKILNKKYNIECSSEIQNRKADFILVKNNSLVINIEANFYKGGGSKPQEIVDSYINRQNDLYENSFDFIWITDGYGWKDQYNQTDKAFKKIDYLLNLNFIKRGLLKEAIKKIYI